MICIFSFVFCYYKVPETRGVTLEEIEQNIRKRKSLRNIGQPTLQHRAIHTTLDLQTG
jgi:hypothetical protein